jgi:hypothetical protein
MLCTGGSKHGKVRLDACRLDLRYLRYSRKAQTEAMGAGSISMKVSPSSLDQ